jgi:hypothetical protein
MANHVSNRLCFESTDDDWDAEELAFNQLTTLMKTDKSPFDFNVLIPSPENSELDKIPIEAELASVSWNNRPQDGLPWSIQNWGTKWNAYAIVIDDICECVSFATAWSIPWPIWEALAQRFKDMKSIRMIIEYADEDEGSNCGIIAYEGGQQLYHTQAHDMPEPVLFARSIIYEHRADVYEQELQEARQKIRELEMQLKATQDKSASEIK